MKVGVVIPVGAGRQENVEECLEYLFGMSTLPAVVALVLDGHQEIPDLPPTEVPVELIHTPRHEPGQEQPRNVGVRVLREKYPDLTHAWFLDSDVIVDQWALEQYILQTWHAVLIGPYEWLPPGVRYPDPSLHNDPRWEMFNERGLRIHKAELGVALGCFSGNLMWPIDEFIRVGGFHQQLHHGRCEDGELGLRAAALGVPMVLVPRARGWHLWHEVNQQLAIERNQRDVPLLNSWHPWVAEKGLIVTEQDGARFDFVCSVCGQQVNTLEMWSHGATHRQQVVPQPDGGDLILPDGMA